MRSLSPPPYSLPHRGFALISALMLLMLMLVVVLGFLSLASSSIRTRILNEHAEIARTNARLALVLAIGELQKELGPDQRISAKAEILDSNTETPLAEEIVHPHWLGSWQSWDDWLNNPEIAETYTKGRVSQFRRWLVSHPKPQNLNDLALPATEGTPEKMVTVVSAMTKGDGATPIAQVSVPKIQMADGAHAWWIAGENQKALITAKPDFESEREKFHNRSGWPNARLDGLAGLEPASDSESEVNRSPSLSSFGLSSDDAGFHEEVQSRFHDLTTHSLGLETNVRNGGLKKDLNLLLESPILPEEFGTYRSNNESGKIVPIREHQGYLPDPFYPANLNFTSWYKLHQYYQLYQGGGEETAADSTPLPFHSAGLWGTATKPNINFNWHHKPSGGNLDKFGIGRTPIVTRLMLVFSTRRVKAVNPPGEEGPERYDYKLGINPVVVLWNPYNVTLHSPATRVIINPGSLEYKSYVNEEVKTDWDKLKRQDGRTYQIGIYPMDDPSADIKTITLKPGETRIYSAVTGFKKNDTGGIYHAELYPGYQAPNADGGFEIELEGLTNLPSTSQVELAMRLNDQSVVQKDVHYGQHQMYWTMTSHKTHGQRFNELAANPVMEKEPIYLAEDNTSGRARFSNNTERIPFSNFQFVMKSGEDLRNPGEAYKNDDFRAKNFIHANPVNQRAMYGEATKRMRGMAQYHVQIESGSGNSLNPDFEPATNRAYMGSAVSLGGGEWPGQTQVITNELPLVPVTSIASLMHFKLNPGHADYNSHKHLWEVSANQALAIGNSFAHPLIAGDAIYQDVEDASSRGSPLQMKLIRDFYDHAYLNNDALWDDWFCSGITREDKGLIHSDRSMEELINDFENGTQPLQNRHLIPWLEKNKPQTPLTEILLDNADPAADSWKKIAQHVMLKGAFNINSTSVEAWEAVLAGLRDEELSFINPDTGLIEKETMPADHVILSRFSLPASPEEGLDAGDPNSWLGIRTLTPAQITRLAQECVRQVKERGPFLNLSDFVNRRLATDETGASGALQAAIDWDENLGRTPQADNPESINARFKGDKDYIKPEKYADWELPFPEAMKGSRYTGIPGYLTQADVLKRIGNIITPRDDTFRIRAYGEAVDAEGKVQARAWCEAVVQRLPEYLDPTDSPEISAEELQQAINQMFGRRLRVTSFKWLSENEI